MENKIEWVSMDLYEVLRWAADCGNKYDDFLIYKDNQWWLWTCGDMVIPADGPDDREEYHDSDEYGLNTKDFAEGLKVVGFANSYRKFYVKVVEG